MNLTWDEAIDNVRSAYAAWSGEFAASGADEESFHAECEATILALTAGPPNQWAKRDWEAGWMAAYRDRRIDGVVALYREAHAVPDGVE